MALTGFPDFLKSNEIYKPTEILSVLKMVRPNFRFSYSNKKTKYFNVPCSFDIETSSFFRSTGTDEQKVAIMYEWTFGIYGAVIVGREWGEFVSMIETLCNELKLTENKRLIIYVHNLSYEFQFMRKWFEWDKVFSIDNRKPIYALTTAGVEFRCSYLLSGYSLAKLGDELRTYTVRKLTGALDYEKIRHNKTELTPQEIAYCVNDVRVVMAYIAERMEQDGTTIFIALFEYAKGMLLSDNGYRYREGAPLDEYFYTRIVYGGESADGILPEITGFLQKFFEAGFLHGDLHFGNILYNPGTHEMAWVDLIAISRPGMLPDAGRKSMSRCVVALREGLTRRQMLRTIRGIGAAESDEEAGTLARTLCREISERIKFPGQIRVTVVRELRCTEYAK